MEQKWTRRMNQWEKWVKDTTNGASAREIARHIGKSHTTVIRWLHGTPPPEAIIQIAIHYNADVIVALVATGWLSEDDLEKISIDDTIKRVETVQLTAELHRRALEWWREQRKKK